MKEIIIIIIDIHSHFWFFVTNY